MDIYVASTSGIEAPILWPSDRKSQLIGEKNMLLNDWRRKEKQATDG